MEESCNNMTDAPNPFMRSKHWSEGAVQVGMKFAWHFHHLAVASHHMEDAELTPVTCKICSSTNSSRHLEMLHLHPHQIKPPRKPKTRASPFAKSKMERNQDMATVGGVIKTLDQKWANCSDVVLQRLCYSTSCTAKCHLCGPADGVLFCETVADLIFT